MKTALLAAASVAAYANTNAGKKVFICSTPEQSDLTATAFAALNWIEIKGIGSFGETGSTTNLLNYPTWDTDVIQKAKGTTDGGSPELEVIRIPTDPGQVALRAAAATNLNYAIKVLGNDLPDNNPNSTPTVRYNRGLITGPRHPNGRNEDFDLEVFMFGLNQREVQVDPIVGT